MKESIPSCVALDFGGGQVAEVWTTVSSAWRLWATGPDSRTRLHTSVWGSGSPGGCLVHVVRLPLRSSTGEKALFTEQ